MYFRSCRWKKMKESNRTEKAIEIMIDILKAVFVTAIILWLLWLSVGGFLAVCKIIYLVLFNL